MLSKMGKWAIVMAAAALLWPASASWAGERGLEAMRAKDYMILEGMRLKRHASEPILAAMKTAEAIPEDELGDLRGGFNTFFFLNVSGGFGAGQPTKTGGALTDFGQGNGTKDGNGFGLSNEEARSLTVVGDFNGGCCFFQINQATGDNNIFQNTMYIDIAMVTVANEAQLQSVVNALQGVFQK